MTTRTAQFPVLYTGMINLWTQHPEWPRSVPLAMMEAVESNCKCNHSQSVERLAQRGGMSYKEILWALMGCEWKEVGSMTTEEAANAVMKMVEEWNKASTGALEGA